MKLWTFETKIHHHEYDELEISCEYNERNNEGPLISIKHAGSRDPITLALDEIEALQSVAKRFSAMISKIGEAQ